MTTFLQMEISKSQKDIPSTVRQNDTLRYTAYKNVVAQKPPCIIYFATQFYDSKRVFYERVKKSCSLKFKYLTTYTGNISSSFCWKSHVNAISSIKMHIKKCYSKLISFAASYQLRQYL